MSDFHLSPEAEVELDSTRIHIARESDSVEIATRSVERIIERF